MSLAADLFVKSPLLAFPLAALGIFIAVFALSTVRVMLRGKHGYDEQARLPLSDDEPATEDRHE